MTKLTNKMKEISSAALIGLAFSFPATADYDKRHKNYEPRHGHHDGAYHEIRPFKVYVSIRSSNYNDRRRGTRPGRYSDRHGEHRRDNEHAENDLYKSTVMRQLTNDLPHNVLLVGSPEQADLVVKVKQTNFDLHFRVTDVDRKDKKYKRDRRYTGGACGVYHRAFYTRVEERGEANAYYAVKYDLKGLERHRDDFRLQASEKFKYGKDLTARTNCGVRPTHHVPSNNVAKLFNQSSPGYRHHVAEEIRYETAEKLGRKLARQIKNNANRFYTNLQHGAQYGAYQENSYSYQKSKPDWVSVVARIVLD